MFTLRNALLMFSLAIPPALIAVYSIHQDLNAGAPDQTPAMHAPGGRSEGDGRLLTLQQITKLYVSRNNGAPAAMRAGTELAPIVYLNTQLESRGEKWRVREAHGLITDIYDVS